MTLQPIGRESGTLADIAYAQISRAMLNGDIKPGARLVMDQLAAELDISRTPVRDALLRLEREGLIEPSGRRGYVVREPSEDELLALYEAREAVEGFAARRVAEIGDVALKLVKAALDELRNADQSTSTSAYAAHMKIHRAVVLATGNTPLVAMFDDIWQRARGQYYFADFLAHRNSVETVYKEHRPLLLAMQKGPEEAVSAMRRHIREGLEVHQAHS